MSTPTTSHSFGATLTQVYRVLTHSLAAIGNVAESADNVSQVAVLKSELFSREAKSELAITSANLTEKERLLAKEIAKAKAKEEAIESPI